jgi:hypothetical protein
MKLLALMEILRARGGLFSGNGGFAEVSGKQSLDFQGLVDLRSTFGIAGTLLLDPTDITISADPDSGAGFSEGGAFAPSGATSTINNVTLQNQLNLGNVTISTASTSPNPGDITVSAPVFWANSNSLTLNADYDINVNSNITTTQGGNITLNAANNINVNSNITTQGGNITLNADSDLNGGGLEIQTSTIDTNGGDFVGNGKGSATLLHGIRSAAAQLMPEVEKLN